MFVKAHLKIASKIAWGQVQEGFSELPGRDKIRVSLAHFSMKQYARRPRKISERVILNKMGMIEVVLKRPPGNISMIY